MGKNIYNRKRGYRYEQKKKKIKRDVISYEDVPLEEYDKENVEISKTSVKKVLFLILGIVVLGLIIFAVANRENLTPEKITRWISYDLFGIKDTGYPVDIVGTGVNDGNFISDDEELCYVSDTTYQALSSNGNEIGYSQISYSHPVLVSSDEFVLIYNLDGYGYVSGKKTMLNKERETKDKIFSADINSKGDYCIVTKSDGYLSKITAYNRKNEKLYAYSFADYYISSVAINNNGTGCIASGISSKNGSMDTVAYVLDFTKETPSAVISLGENLIFAVEYLNSNSVCMIGSNSSFVLNTRNSQLNTINYKQKKLTAFDIDKDTSSFVVSLSRSGDGRQCTLKYISDKGEILNVNNSSRSVKSISLYKNRIAVLDENTCYIYDTGGNYLGKQDAGNGSKAVSLSSSDSAYVLGINEIRKVIEFKK